MNLEEMKERQKHIRNFSIVAHIDHGKSTLADRILEMTDSISKREMKNQILDDMPLERERGITIKLNAVALTYHAKDGEDYIFHLIDTPGHVDFSYEVSRSLAACEGAVLVVDATQGVEAQTLANVFLALDNDLEILPVINKIDLPSADPEGTKKQIEDEIGLDPDEAVDISAKTGMGVDEVLEKIVKDVPAPTGDLTAPLKALIFDSKYDDYRGVVLSVRVVEGTVKKGDRIKLMNGGTEYEVAEVGINSPKPLARDVLMAGDVGYITAAIKDIKDTRVGDTVTSADNPTDKPLEGYRQMTPMVYAGLYPTDNAKFNDLRDALEKLQLNDAALTFEPESSQALGFGFRCGFLGLLHMDVIQERLEREFNLDLITTAPSVTYHVELADGTTKEVENPAEMPDASSIKAIKEPYVRASIMVPNDYVGPVMELCQRKRGDFDTMEYLSDTRVNVIYHIPLSEIIFDFFDKLKSSTRGYASLDYEIDGYRPSNLVKIDILLNGDKVDALSFIAHRDFAAERGREITAKLKKIIPRQNFEIPIQAAIGSKIIARTNIKAYRKDVTARIHTGDPDRRAKLLDKQKRGKKRMKAVGKVDIPQAAFMAVLKTDEQLDEK
ncbi:translation elongation factor 4 [Limosilactobacillus reuteri]|uniref:Elongation factor 4 n=4 Tax=Limosilactobacillus reuteri TaxID=1598 RepID=LEPA_LIMRD|nr:translation elongation factor 4 [Limosilactobacillus reuteri]A5VJE9.1 RecName: Full=Elongation factor 4; Short=EF-4; AltName: Full=Ribosomal back-translocase LepA [Limosilactobacillus reuteri subsp. reuteri]B2G6W5.1 RecName: Full=Elongation factor 4; Short=EF-4; AltName: Full=Ribosomal back-translocase LepA [Limosilactobacillus reuteri subsp. reuteri JCM 1112]ABQ82973.1 GTP-binding protein LepA [Limosilactobacillus reuteri subsp. reuteri]AKP00948.1 GTP-binding protein LepA [Limosilactobacill